MVARRRAAGAPPGRLQSAPAIGPGGRYDRVDALRGAAMLWMAAYHLAFDLNHVGVLHQDVYTSRLWTVQRTCILSLFLLCAGAGSAIARERGQPWPRFWRRWAQVAACALAVSAGSWWMFPRSWIHFGVLHGMAVMLILVRLAAPAGRWLWALGALAMVLPHVAAHPVFNTAAMDWTGLVTRLPITEDYVPLLPWFGAVLWGHAACIWLLARHPAQLAGAAAGGARWLAALGRWPLTFYMLHQPVLLGALAVLGYAI